MTNHARTTHYERRDDGFYVVWSAEATVDFKEDEAGEQSLEGDSMAHRTDLVTMRKLDPATQTFYVDLRTRPSGCEVDETGKCKACREYVPPLNEKPEFGYGFHFCSGPIAQPPEETDAEICKRLGYDPDTAWIVRHPHLHPDDYERHDHAIGPDGYANEHRRALGIHAPSRNARLFSGPTRRPLDLSHPPLHRPADYREHTHIGDPPDYNRDHWNARWFAPITGRIQSKEPNISNPPKVNGEPHIKASWEANVAKSDTTGEDRAICPCGNDRKPCPEKACGLRDYHAGLKREVSSERAYGIAGSPTKDGGFELSGISIRAAIDPPFTEEELKKTNEMIAALMGDKHDEDLAELTVAHLDTAIGQIKAAGIDPRYCDTLTAVRITRMFNEWLENDSKRQIQRYLSLNTRQNRNREEPDTKPLFCDFDTGVLPGFCGKVAMFGSRCEEHRIDHLPDEGKVELPCLTCGKVLQFDKNSYEAKGIFNAFCSDRDCEDRRFGPGDP